MAQEWNAISKLDGVFFDHFDKYILCGFLSDPDLPYIDDLCHTRIAVDRDAAEFYEILRSKLVL